MANPFAPTLLTPVQLAHAMSSGITFTWRFNHVEAGKTQASYVLRRRSMPSGTYEYWNNGTTTWGGSAVYNALTTQSVTVSSGWSAGTTYQWSILVRDNTSADSPYAPDQLLTVITQPTLTVSQPTGSPTESRPLVAWEYTQAQGYAQKRYRVVIYTLATTALGGFTAFSSDTATYPKVWEQDWTTSSTAWSIRPNVDLTNGVQYKAYVQCESEGGVQTAITASATFTMNLDLPNAPTATAVVNNALGAVALEATSSFNLLTLQGSSFENPSGLSGEWIERECIDSMTVYLYNPSPPDGIYALRIAPGGRTYAQADTAYTTYTAWQTAKATYALASADRQTTGVMICSTPTGTSGIPVVAGQVYSFIGQFRKEGATDNLTAVIEWWQANGSAAGTPTSTSASINVTSSGWTRLDLLNKTAPAGAAFASVRLTFDAPDTSNADIYYMDAALFANDANPSFSPGGTSANGKFVIERSADGGLTWEGVPGYTWDAPGESHNSVTVYMNDYDRAAPLGHDTKLKYRFYGIAFDNNGNSVVSSPQVVECADYLVGEGWWVRDHLDPTRDMQLSQIDFSATFNVEAEEIMPEGREYPIVVQSAIPYGEKFSLNTWVYSDDDLAKIMRLLKSRRTLFIQSITSGLRWWVRPMGEATYRQVMAGTSNAWARFRSIYVVTAQVAQVEPQVVQYDYNYSGGTKTYSEVLT